MAIQNRKEIETISVYDPTLGAYHEISLEDAKKQMESLGLGQKEVKEKVQKFLVPAKKKLEDLGLNKTDIARILKDYE